MAFKTLGLMPELITALEEKGYSTPTRIQSQAIPLILEGKDLMAGSQTGTGKTASFTLPLLQKLMKNKSSENPIRTKALILTPTRELASQVEECVKELGKHLPLKSTQIYGGVNIKSQVNRLRGGVDIIVATPGRLLDLVNQKHIDLSHIEILVLDEADRMLDMGFIHDISRILKLLPKKRQNLLFSATFSPEIKKLANSLMSSPMMIEATQTNSTVESISQVIHPVDSKRKSDLLSYLIKTHNWQQVIVFMRTKHTANRLTAKLVNDGITAMAIHGNKSQGARTEALEQFKNGSIRILVATDIAARGIDIDHLPHVVNFDLPNVPQDYVHRIGRTGRAGKTGEAVSLVCIDEHKLLSDIEHLLKKKIPQVTVANFEPDPSIPAQPIVNGRRTPPKNQNPNRNGSSKGFSQAPQRKNSSKPSHSHQKRNWKKS
jgi:ATP-dependent RNA helicase RhlE